MLHAQEGRVDKQWTSFLVNTGGNIITFIIMVLKMPLALHGLVLNIHRLLLYSALLLASLKLRFSLVLNITGKFTIDNILLRFIQLDHKKQKLLLKRVSLSFN